MLNSGNMRKLRYDELAFIEIPERQPKPFEPLKVTRSTDIVQTAGFKKSC